MKSTNRFADAVLAAIHKERILGMRAGSETDHRVIGIWAVVVDGRVFVRSYTMKPRSWWRTFLEDPQEASSLVIKRFPFVQFKQEANG